MVDVMHTETFARPVTLPELKNDRALKDMVLLANSRLSIQPVTEQEWNHINKLHKKAPIHS
jgi:predicted RNA-binding protein with PUA-like domain